MDKELVLHIGSPKTGTTAIQHFMAANTKVLESRGICYPMFDLHVKGIGKARNGHFLYKKTMEEGGYARLDSYAEDVNECFAKLEAILDGSCSTVVLSDEIFWQMICSHDQALPTLKLICDKAGFSRYRVVVYLRRQDVFAESLWNQQIKRSGINKRRFSLTFEEHAAECIRKHLCEYDRSLRRIEDVFGQNNVVLHLYDRTTLKNGDSCADFLGILGVELDDSFEILPAEKNGSIKSRVLLELKRQVNMAPSSCRGTTIYMKPLFELDAATQDQNPGAVMSPEERQAFLAHFADGNRAIAQRYFDRDELFAPLPVDRQSKWEADREEMQQKAFMLLVETLIQHNDKLEDQIASLENRVEYLERVNRNSIILKIERALRGKKMRR